MLRKNNLNRRLEDDEWFFEKIIPYCCENFITIPLAEEGDFRPFLNIWMIPQGNSVLECVVSYKNICTLCKRFFEGKYNQYTFEIEDDLTFEDRALPCNMRKSFTIKIFQDGYILDEDVEPNYSITELLHITKELLNYIEKNKTIKELL
jgi:hypothetical protein